MAGHAPGAEVGPCLLPSPWSSTVGITWILPGFRRSAMFDRMVMELCLLAGQGMSILHGHCACFVCGAQRTTWGIAGRKNETSFPRWFIKLFSCLNRTQDSVSGVQFSGLPGQGPARHPGPRGLPDIEAPGHRWEV